VVDTEDDLQPLVTSAFHLASRSVELLTVALDGSSFDVTRMRERAGQSWVVATEVADALTRDYGVPFGVAHAITSELVRQPNGRGATGSLGDSLRTIARAHGHMITASDDEVLRLVSPEHFIEVRHADGEPAPVAMAVALARSRGRLNEDRAAFAALRAHDAEAAAELEEVFARL
jgi:argininosuccinate lyase